MKIFIFPLIFLFVYPGKTCTMEGSRFFPSASENDSDYRTTSGPNSRVSEDSKQQELSLTGDFTPAIIEVPDLFEGDEEEPQYDRIITPRRRWSLERMVKEGLAERKKEKYESSAKTRRMIIQELFQAKQEEDREERAKSNERPKKPGEKLLSVVLIKAVKFRDKDKVKLLIGSKNMDVNTREADNLSLLHLAAGLGDVGMVELLLNNGANIDIQSLDGDTALHIATSNNYLKLVILLISRRANRQIRNKKHLSPVDMALEKNFEEATRILLEDNEVIRGVSFNHTAEFHIQSGSSRSTMQKNRMRNSADNKVEAKDNLSQEESLNSTNCPSIASPANTGESEDSGAKNKDTDSKISLHEAARSGNIDDIRKGLVAGSSVNGKDATGKTPLHVAVIAGRLNAVKELLKAGADVDLLDHDGRRPSFYARENPIIIELSPVII